ncbi:MAG: hypothetical protein U0271_13020 [Polyangiaceae bacterium]
MKLRSRSGARRRVARWSLAVFFVAACSSSVASTANAQVTGPREREWSGYTSQPLTLPELDFGAELDVTYDHSEPVNGEKLNGGGVDLHAAFGITHDIELELTIFSIMGGDFAITPLLSPHFLPRADWGMSRVGITVRIFNDLVGEIGARFRLLVDNDATVGLNGGLPIRLFAGGRDGTYLRFDTGLGFVGRIPTQDRRHPDFGLVDVSSDPLSYDAGVPLRLLFSPVPSFPLWFGFNTGFGMFDIVDEDTMFIPLGFTAGFSIGVAPTAGYDGMVDIGLSALFPQFFEPMRSSTDGMIESETWQLGAFLRFAMPVVANTSSSANAMAQPRNEAWSVPTEL